MPDDIVFNDIEKETLALAKYHLKRIGDRQNMGKKDPDDDKRVEVLKGIPALVIKRALSRRDYEQSQAKDKAALLKYRQSADCPTCDKSQKVTIIGSAKNEQSGWSLDVVKCTTCKTRFTNPIPNNWDDMLAFMENFYGKLFSETEEANVVWKQIAVEEIIEREKALHDLKAFKEAHLIAEEATKKAEAAWLAADETFESLYDTLLIAKINNENLNPGGKYLA